VVSVTPGFYFSARGRTGRQPYWLFGVLPLSLLGVAAGILGGYLRSWRPELLVFLVLLMPVVLWSWVSLGARRLHDIGLSGWWMAAVIALPSAMSYFVTGRVGPSAFLSAMIILGVIPGFVGDNQFGPDPRTEKVSEDQPADARSNKSLERTRER